MPDTLKPPRPYPLLLPSPDELLRFQVIAELRSKLDGGKGLEEAAAEIAARTHFLIHGGEGVSVTARSVYRWWARFQAKGWPGLRTERGQTAQLFPALPDKLLSAPMSELQVFAPADFAITAMATP